MKLRFLLSLMIPLSLSIAGCGEDATECEDGSDNDGDGLIDIADPGCAFSGGKSEFPDPAACQDGADNDGDGLIDLDDPGCQLPTDNDETNSVSAQCADGIDNDSDGLIDFPNDPGCALSLADSESDDCPDGANCPECGNGVDDDSDGETDYPSDPGCNNAADNDEFNADPSLCGTNVLIQPLPDNGQAMGIFEDTGSAGLVSELISTDCGGTGEENVYIYTLTGPRQVVISTDFAETEVDTVLYLRSECSDMATEIGCNDDTGLGQSSTIAFDRLEAGTYYIVVDSQANQFGNYRLNVDTFTPEKEPCDPLAMECAPGLVCRTFTEGGVTAATETCENPECSDGEDSDGDGLIDFPNEPGCSDLADNDETDDCPAGVGCPSCSNGVDDDGDLLIDFPADPGCASASDNVEIDECITGVIVNELTPAGVTGTTPPAGDGSNFTPSCNTSTASTEDVYAFSSARDLASLTFSTVGSAGDTVLSVRTLECGIDANEVACEQEPNAGETVTIPGATQGEVFFVFVDGDFVSAINYQLNVTGTLPLGSDCDLADTAFVCDTVIGLACKSDVCAPAECSDGITNDGDALIDLFDPGCENLADDDESDDPVVPRQCSDGIDNDTDGDTDYPDDIGCAAASDDLEESCDDSDAIVEILASPIMGTTVGSTNDFTPTCQTNTTAGEIAHKLIIDADLDSLTLTTDGTAFDTVLTLNTPECSSTEAFACDDDSGEGTRSTITVANPPQGLYYVLVDGYTTNTGAYILSIEGTIVSGGSCNPASTLFNCPVGENCDGTSNTCVPAACNDGIDNDGDTFTDYPNDPGCDSISDNDETDDCPTGPNCPQCANGTDDDADTFIDYPADMGCESAADNLEVDDCSPGVPLLALGDMGVTGTTEASGNSDTASSCNTSTLSSEDEYGYRVARDFETLSFSTLGSTGDTVLSVRRGDCSLVADEIACANDTLGESVTVTDPVNGEFLFVIVDGDFISAIDYVLNVSGTLGLNEACVPADMQFTCEASLGLSCDGNTMTCLPSQCSDGIDNDGDTLIDDLDSGCANAIDNDESDDPVPATECVDGMDNDMDGLIDYPADTGCANAAENLEENCTDTDPVLVVDSAIMMGDTTGGTDDFSPLCQGTSTAPDHAYEFIIPGELETLTVDTDGTVHDTVLSIRIAECSGADLECDDDDGLGLQSLITVTDVPAGLYYFVVDAYQSNAGPYTLNVNGIIKAGEACDPTQIAAGFLSCTGATTCVSDICQ